ncbi:MAG: PKD domain-containing protein [Bacteroidetes bacterium]|nr:PKD domain-containing protein [Bacteroidota bacterium]
MKNLIRFSTTVLRLVSLALILVIVPGTFAQEYAKKLRPEGTMFVKPRIGFSGYFGDNEQSPFNFNGDAFDVGSPWNFGLELGYQLSVPFGISLAYVAGDYPVITQFPARVKDLDNVGNDDSFRSSVQAIGRYTFAEATTRNAFYVNFGLSYSFGNVTQEMAPYTSEESGSGFGPLFGAGVDFAINPRSSLFAELNAGLHFGDEGLDGTSEYGFGGGDLLTALGAGLKVNFTKAITPPEVGALTCPTGTVVTDTQVDFSAVTNAEVATQPLELRWEFGTGATATGDSGSHTYTEAGTYEVMFVATNEGGTATGGCTVTVIAPPEILTLTSDKETVSICDEDPSVTFTANSSGSDPLNYTWDFGDGQSSTATNPSHTYDQPGSYTVTLTLTNDAGSDSRTTVVNVNEENCFDCDISEMNTIFFDRNSSVLTDAGRNQLLENLEILQNCEFNVRIEGYSSRDERNAQGLSEDRALSVKQYYIDNGIDEARLSDIGMGAGGQTTKKGAASQFRRVDTIPLN